MKKSLAILIGVSEYDDSSLNLPPCANDVQLMEKAVRLGGHFSDVINIPSTDAAALRNTLASTVQRFKLEEIETLLFYYSGHGEYTEDSFRLLLKDFSKQRTSSTSLMISDLDQMFRSLNPETMVKVIDACYSGAPIIKSAEQLTENVFDKDLFKNCYFLFSSHSDQRSYADIGISDFTKEIIKAIAHSEVEEIRFQQLISNLTDAFIDNQRQTPMFVTQGSGVHSLGQYSQDARAQLSTFVDISPTDDAVSSAQAAGGIEEVRTLSLFERATAQAQRYVSRDTVIVLLNSIKDDLLKIEFGDRFAGMYEPNIEFEFDPNTVPFRRPVGVWLHNNKASGYFMVPDYYEEEYEVPLSEFDLSHIFRKSHKRTRSVVHGYRTDLHGLPFIAVCLEMEPLLENLKKYGLWFTFAVSKTDITFFWAFCDYLERGWGDYVAGETKGFTVHTYALSKASPKDLISRIVDDFLNWVQERVEDEIERQEFN